MGWPGSRAKFEFKSCADRGAAAESKVERRTIRTTLEDVILPRVGFTARDGDFLTGFARPIAKSTSRTRGNFRCGFVLNKNRCRLYTKRLAGFAVTECWVVVPF